MLVGAELVGDGQAHAVAEMARRRVGQGVGRRLFAPDLVVALGEPGAAVLLRVLQPGQPGLGQGGLERAAAGQLGVVVLRVSDPRSGRRFPEAPIGWACSARNARHRSRNACSSVSVPPSAVSTSVTLVLLPRHPLAPGADSLAAARRH